MRNFSPSPGAPKRLLSIIGISAIVFVLLGLPIIFTACSKLVEVSPSLVGYDYMPLEIGHYTLYDLTDVNYTLSGGGTPVTKHYQVKEVVRDTFSDLAGQKSFRIERFSRLKAGDSWELDSVWTARQTASNVVRVENN
ncbi:MAG: hypothetical protein V4714_14275, partial [Bacteroidota bacterium]